MCGNANWMMAVYLNPAETGLNINSWVFGSQVRVGAIWQNILFVDIVADRSFSFYDVVLLSVLISPKSFISHGTGLPVRVDNVSLCIGTDKLKTAMYLVLDKIYTCSQCRCGYSK